MHIRIGHSERNEESARPHPKCRFLAALGVTYLIRSSLCSALFVAAASAQCVPLPLPTTASTRGLAMGNANLAGRDDDVIFYGPAQLAVARGTSVAGERYLDGLAGGTASTTSRLASGGIGVGAQIVEGRNSDECLLQLTPQNGFFFPAARTISRSQAVVGAAQTFKRIRFGLAAKYATETADDQRLSRFLMDVGASRDFTLGDFVPLTAAFAVQSIGGNPTDAFMLGVPRSASLGLSTGAPLGPFDLAIMAQGGVEHSGLATDMRNRPLLRGGVELGYTWLDGYSVAVRAGERTASSFELTRHTTFGVGLVLDRFAFDYAFENLAGPYVGNRFGIRLR